MYSNLYNLEKEKNKILEEEISVMKKVLVEKDKDIDLLVTTCDSSLKLLDELKEIAEINIASEYSNKCFTVGELKERLSSFNDDAPVIVKNGAYLKGVSDYANTCFLIDGLTSKNHLFNSYVANEEIFLDDLIDECDNSQINEILFEIENEGKPFCNIMTELCPFKNRECCDCDTYLKVGDN